MWQNIIIFFTIKQLQNTVYSLNGEQDKMLLTIEDYFFLSIVITAVFSLHTLYFGQD